MRSLVCGELLQRAYAVARFGAVVSGRALRRGAAANEQLGALSARVQAVEGRLAAADADRRRLDVLANELDAVKRFLRDSSPSHTSGYLDEPPKLDEVLARRAQL